MEELFDKRKPLIGVIHVGSYFKEGGLRSNTVERARVERLAEALGVLRERSAGERRDV